MQSKLSKWIAIAFLVLLVNTAYIAAFASPTVFYMGNVLFHLVLGLALSIAVIFLIANHADIRRSISAALALFLISFLAASYLVAAGNIREHRWVLWTHIATALLGVAALIPYARKQQRFRPAFQIALAVLVLFPISTYLYRRVSPNPNDRIRNPPTAPLSMDGEGGGPKSPFFPSSAQDQRRRHHSLQLLHGFGGLRRMPQGHLRAVEKLDAPLRVVQQPVLPEVDRVHAGRRSARSRASGAPAATITPSSSTAASTGRSKSRSIRRKRSAGLGCMSCHAIVHVDGTMGNAGFHRASIRRCMSWPRSNNPLIHALDRFHDLSESRAAPRARS